jgi:CheY-like chemotaxis protein
MHDLTLLLVEDNDDDRFLTMRVLNKLPFPVSVDNARSGDEALDLITAAARQERPLPGVVMLDLQMPRVGGISLLARIRELFGQERLPVIILSSSDNPGDIAACRDLGITAYLSKPLDLGTLQEALAPLQGLP